MRTKYVPEVSGDGYTKRPKTPLEEARECLKAGLAPAYWAAKVRELEIAERRAQMPIPKWLMDSPFRNHELAVADALEQWIKRLRGQTAFVRTTGVEAAGLGRFSETYELVSDGMFSLELKFSTSR